MGADHEATLDPAPEAVRPPTPSRPPALRPASVDTPTPPPPPRLELDGVPVGGEGGRAGFPFGPRAMLGLQRAAGNQAILGALGRSLQRVPMTASGAETLYNKEGAGGKATAKAYGGPKNYDLSRSADASVTATVRVKFLAQ